MATVARDGSGTTILFGTSGFAADVISYDGPGATRDDIDATVMTTVGGKRFIPASNFDNGEITIEIEHEGSQASNIDQPPEAITIDWAGQGTGHKWGFSGYVNAYSPGAEIGSRMQATMTIKVDGDIAVT